MSDALVFGIDCGTQSLRAGLYRLDGTPVACAVCGYETRRPRMNWAEQEPAAWWAALLEAVPRCLREAGAAAEDVVALACDGTSCTAVFTDAAGTPLRPAILWMDIRAAAEAREVEATGHAALESCGGRISPEWLLPKVLWVQREEPEVYRRSAKVIEGVDWLIWRLTGRCVTSNSNAVGKRHWTPQDGWPGALYDALGLPNLVAQSPDELVYLGEAVGTLLPEVAELLGLSPTCVVGHAGMDGWTSPVGMNCFEPGAAALTLGTSTVLIIETDAPRGVEGVMGPFPDGIRRGFSTYEAGQTSGGSTVQWFLTLTGRKGDSADYADLEEAARTIRPGADGLVVFDAFRGNRTPWFDPDARGTICGLTLEHGPGHVYRAILEGCAYGLRNVIDTLERGGVAVRELRACGSGALSPLYTRIIADATRRPVRVCREKQATGLGSAMCAAVACGAYADLPSAAAAMAPGFETIDPDRDIDAYEPYYHAYLETYRRMGGVMARLARLALGTEDLNR